MPLRVPEEYQGVSPDCIRWVREEDVYRWENKGWAVNEAKGKDYGKYDMVLMVKSGCEPKKAKKPAEAKA